MVQAEQRIKSYVRSLLEQEDEPLRAARARSEEADIPAVPPETGALLRFLARTVAAKQVVEIGSGGGYSGLWFLGGMGERGILTTIELEAAHHALAQQAFAEAGVGRRVRSIRGPALQVLPRLADRGYDLVFLDAVKAEYPEYLAHARRLLRPGGLLVADNVLWGGRVADPLIDDADTEALRRFADEVADDPAFAAFVFPVGDGVLAARYDPTASSSP